MLSWKEWHSVFAAKDKMDLSRTESKSGSVSWGKEETAVLAPVFLTTGRYWLTKEPAN